MLQNSFKWIVYKMKKILHYLGNKFKNKQTKKQKTIRDYGRKKLPVSDNSVEFFSLCWARYTQMIQPECCEVEVFEIMNEFFTKRSMTEHNMFLLAELVQSTRFGKNPDRKDYWN
jgi:hypothetical protein